MKQEIDRMNLLVQRLLEFAKPAQLSLHPVCLSGLVQEVLDFLQGTLVQKQIQVTAVFTESDQVLADAGQIKQVFLNLFLNSIEAVECSGHIAISAMRENGHVRVVMKDTGSGIAKNDLARVFDPFFTTKLTGTGLGLSVVHSIVREHGGRVVIQSQTGEGTTVQIHLPMTGGDHGTHPHSDRG